MQIKSTIYKLNTYHWWAFYGRTKMPYKHNLSEVLMMLFTNPPEAIRIIAVMAGGALARACLASSNSHLKRLGDLICCVLMFYPGAIRGE